MSDQTSDPWLMSCDTRTKTESSDDMKFSDNFEPQLKPNRTDSAEPLPDSQQYIRSLEKKLEKLKGKQTKYMSSKQVLTSLSAKREAILQQLLASSDGHGLDIDGQHINNSNVIQYIERRLFPQMQALTEEELQKLLEADVLQKMTKHEDIDQTNTDKD